MALRTHPLNKASKKAAGAVNLFAVAQQQLDEANSILDSHTDSTRQLIQVLQDEVMRAEVDRERNEKLRVKLAEFAV